MGEIKVQVTTSKPKTLQVGSRNIKNYVNVEENPTHYYSTLAKQWAVQMNGQVQDEDYSSKYWAYESKKSANSAQASLEINQGLSELLNKDYLSYNEQLKDLSNETITELETVKTEVIEEVKNSTSGVVESVNQEAQQAIKEIQVYGDEIKHEADIAINNIKSTGFYMEGGKLYYVDDKGEIKEFQSSGTSLSLFTPVTQDHLLSFEESKGYALQGTYVYKTGVAGERYGYPDFVQKCITEKAAGTATETTLGDNTVTIYTNANGHQFYDIADKEAIDAFYEATGIAWVYGVDKENERVFLPRNDWYFKTNNTPGYIEPGLPNFTGTVKLENNAGSFADSVNEYKGIFKQNPTTTQTTSTTGNNYVHGTHPYLNVDGSASNPIFGNSDTVQPPSQGAYLYIIVGNTEAATAETSVVDITTSENDTIPLGFSTWQKGVQPSLAWLASNGQENSGEMYPHYWEWIVKNMNNGVNGFISNKMKAYVYVYSSTESYTVFLSSLTLQIGQALYNNKGEYRGVVSAVDGDSFTFTRVDNGNTYTATRNADYDSNYDFSAPANDYYHIINQDAMTFKLPLSDGDNPIIEEGFDSSNNVQYRVYNNGKCEQWGIAQSGINTTVKYSKTYKDTTYNLITSVHSKLTSGVNFIMNQQPMIYNKTVNSFSNYYGDNYYAIEWYTCGELSSQDYAPKTLYFKVGNAVQNQELIDLGEVTNALATKLSAANSRKIVNMIAPDWSNVINLNSTTSYTAPDYGWIYCVSNASGATTSSAQLNGVTIAEEASDIMDIHVFVNPGDKLTSTAPLRGRFLPCKGVK